MAKAYRPYVPEQDFLLPPSLREWLPKDHVAYFVSDKVQGEWSSVCTTRSASECAYHGDYSDTLLERSSIGRSRELTRSSTAKDTKDTELRACEHWPRADRYR
jgi:hypothetical protein